MARESLCPPEHSHSQHCYSKHGCRCEKCRAANARQRIRTYFSRIERNGGPRLIPSVGAERRLRALAYIGWSTVDLSQMCGTDPSYLGEIRAGKRERVAKETHSRIDALYQRLCVTPNQKPSASLVSANAKRNGYKSALYWEDIDRDGELGYLQYA